MLMFDVAHITVLLIASHVLLITSSQLNASVSCQSFFECARNEQCCIISLNPLSTACDDSCVGHVCRSSHDCAGPNECCDKNVCTDDIERCGCTENDPVCSSEGKHCCQRSHPYQIRRCKYKCLSYPCTNHSDCAYEECCNIFNKCAKKCNLNKCDNDSECSNGYGFTYKHKCCDYQRYNGGILKVCMHTCSPMKCIQDSDCVRPDECCGEQKQCTSCIHDHPSLKTTIILASVIAYVIICLVIALTSYCRRKGSCIFKRRDRVNEEFELCPSESNNELNETEQSSSSIHNGPPPPYTIVEGPSSQSHNREFPPRYKSQDL